jgi:hypothetical protein
MKKDQKKNMPGRERSTQKEKVVPEKPEQKTAKQNEQLTKEDLPDSTNESQGTMGSGQRQDSN